MELRRRYHNTCPVCGASSPSGPQAEFCLCDDGTIEAEVTCGESMQGYNGILHGGVIATLLDGAMTNCLFSFGIAAVTGELTMRLLHPVMVADPLIAKAWLKQGREPLYYVASEIRQGGRVAARGSAKFMRRNGANGAWSKEWNISKTIPSLGE